jgi:hypothetical protein
MQRDDVVAPVGNSHAKYIDPAVTIIGALKLGIAV